MEKVRKVTVVLPASLLRRAQKSTGGGITPTIRRGLELVAAANVYGQLRRPRGQVAFSVTVDELREDAK
jgi:hypothetical protein